jgi:hypothetical protein
LHGLVAAGRLARQYRADVYTVAAAEAFFVSHDVLRYVQGMAGTEAAGKETATGYWRTIDIKDVVQGAFNFCYISLNTQWHCFPPA